MKKTNTCEERMAKAYLAGLYVEFKDPKELAAYARLGVPALEANGGRVLARGRQVHALEGGIVERTIVVAIVSRRDSPIL